MPIFKKAGPIITRDKTPWTDYLHLGVKREYRAGTYVLHAGDHIKHLYFLEKGEVIVSHYTSPGMVNRLFIMRDGAMLGLIGLFTASDVMASWLAVQDSCIYLFDKDFIYNDIPRHLLLNSLEQLSFMGSSMTRRFTQGSSKRHEVRLARLLLHLIETCPQNKADGTPSELIITPSITQEMLSELLNIHPVTLNKLLSAFREQGLIGKFTKKKLKVYNLEVLSQYAAGTLCLLE